MSPLVGRVRRDTSRRDVYIAICGIGRRHRTGCHRTIRANIRFDLDGGPQGSNPHFLRTYSYPSMRHKPIEARFGPRRADRRRPGPVSLCAFHPSARSRIRASDSSSRPHRIEPGSAYLNPSPSYRIRASDRVCLRVPTESGRGTPRGCPWWRPGALTSFVLTQMGVVHLTPSCWTRHVVRFHGSPAHGDH